MKYINKFKSIINSNKKLYIFSLTIMILGVVFGAVFFNMLGSNDKNLVITKITDFIMSIQNGKLDCFSAFKNTLISNITFIILIWFLGISVIGIVVIIIMLFIKGFILGFSIGALIYKYKLLGILSSIVYIFPHQLMNFFITLIVGIFSLKLAFNLSKAIFKKGTINFKDGMKQYYFILFSSIVFTVMASAIEIYVLPVSINLFKFLF
ncbi:MAG: stage II sporulation protein M [Bacilli bacterium]